MLIINWDRPTLGSEASERVKQIQRTYTEIETNTQTYVTHTARTRISGRFGTRYLEVEPRRKRSTNWTPSRPASIVQPNHAGRHRIIRDASTTIGIRSVDDREPIAIYKRSVKTLTSTEAASPRHTPEKNTSMTNHHEEQTHIRTIPSRRCSKT